MLGENIKRYRLFKGLSLRAFGELTGLSQTAIMKYEKNELKPDGESTELRFFELGNLPENIMPTQIGYIERFIKVKSKE